MYIVLFFVPSFFCCYECSLNMSVFIALMKFCTRGKKYLRDICSKCRGLAIMKISLSFSLSNVSVRIFKDEKQPLAEIHYTKLQRQWTHIETGSPALILKKSLGLFFFKPRKKNTKKTISDLWDQQWVSLFFFPRFHSNERTVD